jgi:hypothetical protein
MFNQKRRLSMAAREADKIDRDDLFLLMESYKNTIELNTTLLERQEIVNDMQVKLMESIKEICKNQSMILSEIKAVPDAFLTVAEKIAGEIKKLNDNHTKDLRDIKDNVATGRNADFKEHAGLNMRIYVALSGMAAIVAALVGLIVTIAGGK